MQPLSYNWPEVLSTLVERKDLSIPQARFAMEAVLSGDAPDASVGAFATLLRAKGETAEEIAALVDTMYEFSVPLPGLEGAVDTAGTGGDNSGSVNISTMAAIVVATAGVKVLKHGNRAASSKCGAADLVEALGVPIELDADEIVECVERTNFGFAFAQVFHPALGRVAKVRRELGVRTTFNFLGPLANPARVKYQLLGVSDEAMVEVVAAALALRGARRALVFQGSDGFDELTTWGVSKTIEVRDGELIFGEIDATALDLEPGFADAVAGGTASENAAKARDVFGGSAGPVADIVALNAGAALYVAGNCDTVLAGVGLARRILVSGAALETLERLVKVSTDLLGKRGLDVAETSGNERKK